MLVTKPISGAGDLLADGTVPLTADWNVGAFKITAKEFAAGDGTAAAPGFLFSSSPTTGLIMTGGNLGFSVNEGVRMNISSSPSNGLRLSNDMPLGWTPATSNANAPDLMLHRDAANTLAQRNLTNAQTSRIYKTYTDASNYERLAIDTLSDPNVMLIKTESAGTGINRSIGLVAANLTYLGAGGVVKAYINSDGGGSLIPVNNNLMDIGSSSNKLRDLHVGRNVYMSGLPTSDPAVAGQLWNNLGILTISAG